MNSLPLPPQELRFMQESDEVFISIGDDLVASLKTLAGFQNNFSVIDIGSGYGRLAHALVRQGFQGKYIGIEILKRHVTWCQEHLSSDRLQFEHLDVCNSRYNPSGTIPASAVKLDELVWSNKSDLIVLTSVFTHMMPAEIENYIDCFSRMLLPGGSVCATFFLLNESRRGLIEKKQSGLSFPFQLTDFSLYHNENDPLHAIAFDESWVIELIQKKGMIVKRIKHGNWCEGSRANTSQYQDFVVFAME